MTITTCSARARLVLGLPGEGAGGAPGPGDGAGAGEGDGEGAGAAEGVDAACPPQEAIASSSRIKERRSDAACGRARAAGKLMSRTDAVGKTAGCPSYLVNKDGVAADEAWCELRVARR